MAAADFLSDAVWICQGEFSVECYISIDGQRTFFRAIYDRVYEQISVQDGAAYGGHKSALKFAPASIGGYIPSKGEAITVDGISHTVTEDVREDSSGTTVLYLERNASQ